jgi:hypothetical protein
VKATEAKVLVARAAMLIVMRVHAEEEAVVVFIVVASEPVA